MTDHFCYPEHKHFYHHFFCQKCQRYTVFDAGTCTKCGINKDLNQRIESTGDSVVGLGEGEEVSRGMEK